MTKIKMHLPVRKLGFAISWGILVCTQVQASVAPLVILGQRPPVIFDAPPPPKGIGAPSGTDGGAGRGRCKEIKNKDANKQISSPKVAITLVPIYGSGDSEWHWALTTAEHPTFWFYVPYQSSFSGQFQLFEQGNPKEHKIYQADFTLTGKPGFVNISLPSKVANLEIGKQYHWSFKINCESGEPPDRVEGWIQRNSLDQASKSQLERATLQKRITLYANKGIWYEALTTAAELHPTDPTYWAALLHSIGLETLVSEPIIECCKPEKESFAGKF